MARAWQLRGPGGSYLPAVFRGKLAPQTDGFGGLGCRSRLERLEKPLRGVLSQVTDNRGEHIAILAESAVSESIGYVMDRRLGHQDQDVHHAVGGLAAAHGFFN